jgi:hypothetical protein
MLILQTPAPYTDRSLCDITKHIYPQYKENILCKDRENEVYNRDRIEKHDTILVVHEKVSDFITYELPHIQTPVVIISHGNLWKCCHPVVHLNFNTSWATAHMFQNEYIVAWFTTNKWNTHPKLYGLPHGLWSEKSHKYMRFWKKELDHQTEKKQHIFFSHLGLDHRPHRIGLPSGKALKYNDYLKEMAQSEYVFSPNGDRPDCIRNLEAIGLGTVPVTQLNRSLYGFYGDSMLYSVQNITRTSLIKITSTIKYNRFMVFLQFWKDYINNIVPGIKFKNN